MAKYTAREVWTILDKGSRIEYNYVGEEGLANWIDKLLVSDEFKRALRIARGLN